MAIDEAMQVLEKVLNKTLFRCRRWNGKQLGDFAQALIIALNIMRTHREGNDADERKA